MLIAHLVRTALQWRHNETDGVLNHQPHDCLLNSLFMRRWKKTANLRVTVLCAEIHRGPVNSPHKGPVTRKMFPFDNVIMGYIYNLSHNLFTRYWYALFRYGYCIVLDWFIRLSTNIRQDCLTHLLDKMAAVSQMIFANAFSWMKRCVFWLQLNWSLFPRVQLTITQHWLR